MKTTFPVAAPADAWAALADPERLATALPGCRSVTRDAEGDGTLRVVADVGVASVSGLWAGTVVPVDGDAVRVTGSGAPGSVDLVVRADPERTSITIEGTIEGALGTVGSAVLAAAVRRTADDLLAGLAHAQVEAMAHREVSLVPRPRESPAPAAGGQNRPHRPHRSQRLLRRKRGVAAAAAVILVVVIRRSRGRAG